jgi:hypothetical protein
MFLALLAALSANIPPSVAAPRDDGQAIVVQGIRDPRRPATEYINQVIPPMLDGQLGRFEEPLCPDAVGLPANLKAEVLARIQQVAAVAGVPVRARNCTANLLIIVVDDKKSLIEGMRRQKQSYVYGVGAEQLRRLASSPAPVAAWQISDVIGADGMPLRVDADGVARLFTTIPPSRLADTTRKRLLGSVLVIEQRGLRDVTTRQLADYALVRALAPIEPRERTAPGSSVLSLFNDGVKPEDAPQSLTWWDLAFLKALSNTRSDILASVQRDEIRDRMIKEIAKIPAEER